MSSLIFLFFRLIILFRNLLSCLFLNFRCFNLIFYFFWGLLRHFSCNCYLINSSFDSRGVFRFGNWALLLLKIQLLRSFRLLPLFIRHFKSLSVLDLSIFLSSILLCLICFDFIIFFFFALFFRNFVNFNLFCANQFIKIICMIYGFLSDLLLWVGVDAHRYIFFGYCFVLFTLREFIVVWITLFLLIFEVFSFLFYNLEDLCGL